MERTNTRRVSMGPSGRLMLAALVWSLAAVCSPTVARADSAAELARRHNAEAEKAFNLGRFAEAIIHYEKAYQAKQVSELLYNLGQCHKRLGSLEHLKKALFYFEAYQNNATDLASSRELEATIAEVKQRIAALRAQQSTEAKWRGPTGWVALSVGGASLVTGIVFSVLAKQKTDEFQQGVEQKRPWGELDEIDRTGKQVQTVQIVTLAVGGVLAGVGGGLLLWDMLGRRGSHESPRAGARVIPWATASGVGLSGVARF